MKDLKEVSADFSKWQMHNLRASKITTLYKEGWKLNDIMKVSGHKSVTALSRYIKVDEEAILKNQIERNMKSKKL